MFCLADGGERPQHHRGDRDEHHDLLPLRQDARKCRERHPGEHRQRRDLRRRGEERGDGCRCALIDVGCPHVERHRRDLEAEPGEQEHQAEHDADAAGFGGGGDAGEADRAGEAIDQRGAVQQHAGRQRPQHEIFQPGFGRFRIVAVAGRDHVQRKAHQFQPEIEHDEVAGRNQHHHPKRREQHQDRVFEDPPRRVGEKFRRQDQRRHRADQRQDLQEAGKVVDNEAAAEGRELSGRKP